MTPATHQDTARSSRLWWIRSILLLVLYWGAAQGADPAAFHLLPSAVTDAEFDVAHDRVVMVSATPAQLQCWMAGTAQLMTVDLPAVPTCVSVSPDGASAAVGHDGFVTVVDLGTFEVSDSWVCTTDAEDIVHGGNGFAYVFSGSWWEPIHCVDLSSGVETFSEYSNLYANTIARKQPGASTIYCADNGVSTMDIRRFGIAGGTADYEGESPYHGDHPMGGNLWFNDAGTRILTRSGNVFHSTDAVATDMTYAGHLATPGELVWADHGGADAGWFATIPVADDTRVDLVHGEFLGSAGSRILPAFPTPDGAVASHGRWVFLSADGGDAYVVAQADAIGGLADDHAIIRLDLTPVAGITITGPATDAVLGGSFTVIFQTTAWPPAAGGSVKWSLDGTPRGVVNRPIQVGGIEDGTLPAGDHVVRVELVDHLNMPTGMSDAITVHVLADQPGFVRLGTDVVDAEYDAQHERLVLVGAMPPQLQIWGVGLREPITIELPSAPTCVSVSPDGASAAVGHDGRVTLVDLQTLVVSATWVCSADALDIVHGGNGFAYVFPKSDQWQSIRCIDLDAGIETDSGQSSIYAGTFARKRPGALAVYGAQNGLNSPSIERYSIASGTALFEQRSPYLGAYETGGNLWFDEPGTRILTRSGTILRLSDDLGADMAFAGHLPIRGDVVWADHHGAGDGWFATIPAADDTRIDFTNGDLLDSAGTRELPAFSTLGEAVDAHGRWVFLSADGNTAYVIARADASGGLINDHAIIRFDLTPVVGIAITGPAADAVLGGSFTVSFRTTAWPPPAGGSVKWSLDGVPRGEVTGPFQVGGMEDGALSIGDHVVRVELIDHLGMPTGISDAITVHVHADQPGLVRLGMDVVDAEFDAEHDRLVLVGAMPPQMQIWGASLAEPITIELPLAPTCVSVSPDGASAAVGHDGWVTLVDLQTLVVSAKWVCSTDARDIVHGGNGFAYVFPKPDQWQAIRCIDLATGDETDSGEGSLNSPTSARKQPGALAVYGAQSGVSPSDIERYSISSGTAEVGRDSPYHGDLEMGGNLWFNDAGTRILTQAGNLFQATDDPFTDMTYAGHLPQRSSVVWADHGGPEDGWFATIPMAEDTRIEVVDGNLLTPLDTFALPAFSTLKGTVASHGRWVFLSADGHAAHVVAQADASGGLVNDFAVITYDTTPRPSIALTAPRDGASLGGPFVLSFRTTAWPPAAGGAVVWSLDGIVCGVLRSPLQIGGLTTGDHTIKVELIDHLGNSTGFSDAVEVHVADTRSDFQRLATDVVDAEFDAVHGRLVLVGEEPAQLQILTPSAGELISIALPTAPTCVSVSPDGASAAVGHDGRVTLVDLNAWEVEGSWVCSTDAVDIVHGGNDFAYVLPDWDQLEEIRCINLLTGVETRSPEGYVYGDTFARKRPGAPTMYGSRLKRYAIAGAALAEGPSVFGYQSVRNLWFNDAGTRILADSGSFFQARDDDADRSYAGHLPIPGTILWADHGGPGVGWFATIPLSDDTRIDLVDGDLLGSTGTRELPAFPTLDGAVAAHGRWVFLSADGDTAYVVARADASGGLVNDHAIITLDLAPTAGIAITGPVPDAVTGGSFTVSFRTTAWPPPAGGSVVWSLDGATQGAVTGSFQVGGAGDAALEVGDHVLRIDLIDHLGVPTGISDSVSVHVLADPPHFARLGTDVVDAEFDAVHDRLVLVSASPAQLQVWGSSVSQPDIIELPTVPTCVSVSPDGASATVGHDGRVTLVDLQGLTVNGTWTCSTDALDIVHGGNGFAYVFPKADQWVAIRCIDLDTGMETVSERDTYAGTLARKRPGVLAMYGARQGASGIHRYGIAAGTSHIETYGPFDGTYMGANLWFDDAGARILSSSGNLVQATDMVYVGSLPTAEPLAWADHGGPGAGWFATLSYADDTHLSLVRGDDLTTTMRIPIPSFQTSAGDSPAHGRWVFLSDSGETAFVVAGADAESHLVNDQAVIRIDLIPQIDAVPNLETTVGTACSHLLTSSPDSVPFTVSALHLPEWLELDGNRLHGTPPEEGEYGPIVITATNSLGMASSVSFSISVHAADEESDGESCGTGGGAALLLGSLMLCMVRSRRVPRR